MQSNAAGGCPLAPVHESKERCVVTTGRGLLR